MRFEPMGVSTRLICVILQQCHPLRQVYSSVLCPGLLQPCLVLTLGLLFLVSSVQLSGSRDHGPGGHLRPRTAFLFFRTLPSNTKLSKFGGGGGGG